MTHLPTPKKVHQQMSLISGSQNALQSVSDLLHLGMWAETLRSSGPAKSANNARKLRGAIVSKHCRETAPWETTDDDGSSRTLATFSTRADICQLRRRRRAAKRGANNEGRKPPPADSRPARDACGHGGASPATPAVGGREKCVCHHTLLRHVAATSQWRPVAAGKNVGRSEAKRD